MLDRSLPKIAITAGDPAGIGPELIVKIAQDTFSATLVAIGNADLLQRQARQLGLPLTIHPYQPETSQRLTQTGGIHVLDVPLHHPVVWGKPNQHNAHYILESLTQAASRCLKQEFAAIVTGPVNKAVINQAGIPFTGHTEFFAQQTQTAKVVMMLAIPEMRVALATTHLPLSQVAAAITPTLLKETLTILHNDLQRYFGIQHPRILVCGLNPHAGEGGHIGQEERDVIEPTLQQLRAQGLNLHGPLAADTIFTAKYLAKADAILAMYHDQGLPVLKCKGFGQAVNITLGMPIIRTSVDHGTGFDIAGSGQANPDSLRLAIETAIRMSTYHRG